MTEPTENPIMSTELVDEQEPEIDQLAVVKARAQRLGIKFHPSIGLDALRSKIAEALATKSTGTGSCAATLSDELPSAVTKTKAAPADKETRAEARARLRKEAGKLVRIRLTCMNPSKKDWLGEVFTVSNSVVGTYRKMVPFNNDEGWHVPQFILNMIKERKFQTFYSVKGPRGVTIRKGKLVPEFAVEIMSPLTPAELAELARRQAMAGNLE